MRIAKLLISIVILIIPTLAIAQQKNVFFAMGASLLKKDSLVLNVSPAIDYMDSVKRYSLKVTNGVAILNIYIKEPGIISSYDTTGKNILQLVEPNDSVIMQSQAGQVSFKGKGAAKFEVIYKAQKLANEIPAPSHPDPFSTLTSVADYLEWYRYTVLRQKVVKKLLKEYKPKLSPFAHRYLTAMLLATAEYPLTIRFQQLYFSQKKSIVTPAQLASIFDSTLAKSPIHAIVKNDTNTIPGYLKDYLFEFVRLHYSRKQSFDDFITTEPSDDKRRRFYSGWYDVAKNNYGGRVRESLLAYITTSWFMKRLGFTEQVDSLLTDYYQLPGYTKYRSWVKNYESIARTLEKGNKAPAFALTTLNDSNYTSRNLSGKVVLMDFWYTGCVGCASATPALKNVAAQFKDNPNVEFVSVSIDRRKETWQRSVSSQKYTTGAGVTLYTGGLGANHPAIRAYNVSSYPTLFLINAHGEVAVSRVPRPDQDSGRALIEMIKKQLTEAGDGPYVFHNAENITVKTIVPSGGELKIVKDSFVAAAAHSKQIVVGSDEYDKPFTVTLKPYLKNEPSEFSNVTKQLAVSDIEGNFTVFHQLLRNNGVIDENYNWTFGNGHLVLVGDFFDRGSQVTQCLWLIYSLEEKAKASGGYVHFILGNHDIMNLNGDHRYVQAKYKYNAALMGEKYDTLYSTSTELGRWLRTKNIAEKIGNILYVHGGIGSSVNSLDLTLTQMNDMVRPLLPVPPKLLSNGEASLLLNPQTSPFWYRDYYEAENKRPSVLQIDSTLAKFNVQRIVTGHTIVGNVVKSFYSGKVINLDTRHAKGKTEALLVDKDIYYRINLAGQKRLLWDTPGISQGKAF